MKHRYVLLWIKVILALVLLVSAFVGAEISSGIVLSLSLPLLSCAFQMRMHRQWEKECRYSRLAGINLLDILIGLYVEVIAVGATYATIAVGFLALEEVELNFSAQTAALASMLFIVTSIVSMISATIAKMNVSNANF